METEFKLWVMETEFELWVKDDAQSKQALSDYSLKYNWIWIKYKDLFSDKNFIIIIIRLTNQQNHPKRNHMFLFQHLQRKIYHNLWWSCQ